jgi:hypothetical protein
MQAFARKFAAGQSAYSNPEQAIMRRTPEITAKKSNSR